jgi:serine/threonine protein kinase/class 3 adenylate cyclase
MNQPIENARILTLVFTDLADSTGLKTELGDQVVGKLIAQHREHVQELSALLKGSIVDWAGDGCFLTFETASSAVLFALNLQRKHADDSNLPKVRIGINMGEVSEGVVPDGHGRRVEGLAVDLTARIEGLATPSQILMSSAVFNSARQRLLENDFDMDIVWLAHGPFKFKGFDDAMEICEVGVEGIAPLSVPDKAEKAQRAVAPTDEDTFGWRPAAGQLIPGHDHWTLERQLGVGGYGEVWLAQHVHTHDRHVFKFCFQPDRLRGLKREVVLFRLLRESLGSRDDISKVLDWELEKPPFYIEAEYTEAGDIKTWAAQQGGLKNVSLETRIDLVRQTAEALHAAHSAGVLHKDIKPANILINEHNGKPHACLTDFGIGLLSDPEALKKQGITATGMTQTLAAGNSSSTSGTGMYLAPEIHEGKPPSERSDIYSLGVLLYQMVVGDATKALAPGWERNVGDDTLRADIAACIDGDPAQRLSSAGVLAENLSALGNRQKSGRVRSRRNQSVKFMSMAAVAAVIVAAGWFLRGTPTVTDDGFTDAQQAYEVDLPKIQDAITNLQFFEAFQLLEGISKILPADDPLVVKAYEDATGVMTILTEPEGAKVSYRPYSENDDDWIRIGETPIESRLPRGTYRWRLEKDGYGTRELVERVRHPDDIPVGAIDPKQIMFPNAFTHKFELIPIEKHPEEMVLVDSGGFIPVYGSTGLAPMTLDAFLIDRTEVTNAAFQEFVNAGGYTKPEYWDFEFEMDGQEVDLESAMTKFVDTTGRPGPADWEIGRFKQGTGNLPVSGISWFEAAAYATYAGKELPTIYHWSRAVYPKAEIIEPLSPLLVPASNFSSEGPTEVASNHAIAASGIHDAAGNVREWCANRLNGNPFALGGSWPEMNYLLSVPVSVSPWDRSHKNGFRCIKPLGSDPIPGVFTRDFRNELVDMEKRPQISEDVFQAYHNQFLYSSQTDVPLNPRIEFSEEYPGEWKLEKVLINTNYNDESVIVHIATPLDMPPPYETVVISPGADATFLREFNLGYMQQYNYLVQTGRAIVFPICSNTYDRGNGTGLAMFQNTRNRARIIKEWINDFGRTIDYLETRDDLDTNNLTYLGISMGTMFGPVLNVNEPRFKIALYVAGGFFQGLVPFAPAPEVDSFSYMAHHTIPTLMMCGNSDYIFPVETAQTPFFNLLGTPDEHKKHVTFNAGHVPLPRAESMKETLAWLDKYQNPESGGE